MKKEIKKSKKNSPKRKSVVKKDIDFVVEDNNLIKTEDKNKTFSISFDLKKFEKVASVFGFYNQDFLNSLEKSEKDIKNKRFSPAKSLKEMM